MRLLAPSSRQATNTVAIESDCDDAFSRDPNGFVQGTRHVFWKFQCGYEDNRVDRAVSERQRTGLTQDERYRRKAR